jgi:hypothetical protein
MRLEMRLLAANAVSAKQFSNYNELSFAVFTTVQYVRYRIEC